MKKTLIYAAIISAAVLTACAASKKTEETVSEKVPETETVSAQETKAPATEAALPKEEDPDLKENLIGMPNPMKKIEDTGMFEQELGIRINADMIDENAEKYIIGGRMADVTWHQENVNAEDVELTLRATKDAEAAPMMHGIYDSNMTDEYENEIQIADEKIIKLHFMNAATEGYGIYTWKDGQIFYSLTYNKSMSQMALAEILDRIMDATGIRYHKDILSALPYQDVFEDGIYPATIDKDGIKKENGKYVLPCELHSIEYFDAVEVSLMQVGDSIVIDGDMAYEIESIEKTSSGEISINGNKDGDGFYLSPADGGTYKVRGLDDMCSYAFRGNMELKLAEDAVLTDTSDIENGCPEIKVSGAAEIIKYITENDRLYLVYFSTDIRTEDSEIKEINVRYVP